VLALLSPLLAVKSPGSFHVTGLAAAPIYRIFTLFKIGLTVIFTRRRQNRTIGPNTANPKETNCDGPGTDVPRPEV
jgi:hypothetical protein